MPFDREDALKKAEKLLRQGRLGPAVAEYRRVVDADPADMNTANVLGDLYVRSGDTEKAAEQFGRVAEHFFARGFLPRAAALYKKLLKLKPDDEQVQLRLAEMAQQQGLLADAKVQYVAIAARRRSRGDRAGAAEIVVRLGAVDPLDYEARRIAAATLAEMGDAPGAAAAYRALFDDLSAKERPAEALDALRQAVAHAPDDREARTLLARAAADAGDMETARAHVDRDAASRDPALLPALLEMELRAGHVEEARAIARELIERGDGRHDALLALAASAADRAAAFAITDAVVEDSLRRGAFAEAAMLLQHFVERAPDHLEALRRWVDVCAAGRLESRIAEAETHLADACLARGAAAEARDVVERLIAREPWDRAHLERFRRALSMLRVDDPDRVIADRLGGLSPFTVSEGPAPAAGDAFPAPPESHDAPPAAVDAEGARAPDALAAGAAAPRPAPIKVASFDGATPTIELTAGPPPVVAVAAPASPATPAGEAAPGEIDLADELSALDRTSGGGPDDDAPAVPARGAQEAVGGATAPADLSEQQMTMARTYMDMGMQDQAAAAFEIAVRAPRHRFEAAAALGRICRSRRELERAATWLERACEAPPPDAETGRAVAYEFGVLLEELGETARALAVLLELQAEAGEYRDAGDRVARLTRLQAEAGG